MKKILLILVVGIFVISGFAEVIASDLNKTYSKVLTNSCLSGDNTLITEYTQNRIIEIDTNGTIVWQKTGLETPVDAERLDNGNTLIVEPFIGRVIEVDSGGAIVWQKTGLNGPWDAERLDNGNTLIVELAGNRVIEIVSGGAIVWQKTGLNGPWDAERLDNGNTLVAEMYGDRVIEVDSGGAIVWEKTVQFPADAERLDNGNTLITEFVDRVIEVDNGGAIVWEKTGLDDPFDAERLDDGNTLIVELASQRVIEVDNGGAIVWEKTGLYAPYDAERLNNGPPEVPIITGETQGHYGESYDYTFVSTDRENQDVRYYIEWGDDTFEEWIGPFVSGEEVVLSHTWDEEDTYTIRAKAKDIFDAESQWGTLSVTMPVNQHSYSFPLLQRLLERFPNAFPILRQLLDM